MNKNTFKNRSGIKAVVLGLGLLMLFTASFASKSFAQLENQTSPFDSDAPISDLAYNVTEYHKEQAQKELEKTPPNVTGAILHENLAGMSLTQIVDMVVNATLSPENIQKIKEAGIENCVIKSNAEVICFN